MRELTKITFISGGLTVPLKSIILSKHTNKKTTKDTGTLLAYFLRVETVLRKKYSLMQSKNFPTLKRRPSTVYTITRQYPNPEQEDILTLPRNVPCFNFKTIHHKFAF
jgi:hypothetical protein